MPTYEYACGQCGHELEIFQSIRDERLVTCPSCQQNALKRLIGRGAGIIFKGTGFYQTDYKGNSGKGGASEDKAPPAADKPAGSSNGASSSGSAGSSAAPASQPNP
jgi:putative FmdB family regulatory protein